MDIMKECKIDVKSEAEIELDWILDGEWNIKSEDEDESEDEAVRLEDIESVVKSNIIAIESRFSTEAKKNPIQLAKEAREMFAKGIMPEMIEDGILRGDDPRLKTEFKKPLPPVCATPYHSLNDLLDGGFEVGSINIVTAETGIGKSTVTGELMYHFYQNDSAIGMCALEDTHSKTAKRMISIGHSDNLMRKDIANPDQVFDKYLNNNRYYQYNDFGAVDRTIPFMLKLEGMCMKMKKEHVGKSRWILIDHISMLVAHAGVTDERQALDIIMNDLMRLGGIYEVGFIVICHLSRANTSGASDINRLRGSAGIGQMANTVISVKRLDDTPEASEGDRNTLKVIVSKNRRSGSTGMIHGNLVYDKETGRLLEDVTGFGIAPTIKTDAFDIFEDFDEISNDVVLKKVGLI